MSVGEVTESLDSTVVLVDPHTLSQISWYSVRGAGQLLEVFLMLMETTLITPSHTTRVSLHVAVHDMKFHVIQ